jgi:hypothetical protein
MVSLQSLRDVLAQRRCLHPEASPELFGPTNINAQTGNQRLAVALDGDGTVTVLRWPRPSFYDQLKYRARDRDQPYAGALPNEGAFLGLRIATRSGVETVWLRDQPSRQRYASKSGNEHAGAWTDTVVTTYDLDRYGLTVTVRDVVPVETDALVRSVTVEREPDSRVTDAWLVNFANPALVTSKRPRRPVDDWCCDADRIDTARYDDRSDAVVFAADGVDESTGTYTRVALGIGFAGASDGHQVGGDAHEPVAPEPTATDAYADACDGPLSGTDAHSGRTTAAMSRRLSFDDDTATATALLVAGPDEPAVDAAIGTLRERDAASLRADKRAFYESLLADAPMPDTDDEAILALCRRALVTLVSNYDPRSGAVVASIATQNPYALDWPRDGAFFNHALHLLGLESWAERRCRWYAELQAGSGDPQPGELDVPDGHWAMNYYGDGVVGGPIPYEVDQTAYAVWALWDHYATTGDESYLADVYPAIRRAAERFCADRDPETGLHEPANEDDNALRSQTVVGAAPVWLALGAAAAAARERGETTAAERYETRRAELGDAIERHLWDEREGAYTGGSGLARAFDVLSSVPVVGPVIQAFPLVPTTTAQPAIFWPVGFRDADDPRMARHLDHVFEHLTETFAEPERGDRTAGRYETMSLIALAQAWRGDPDRMAAVRRGVEWVAYEHATNDTHIMGEMWMTRNGGVVTAASQPHTWAQLLFYYASLEAFPPEGFAESDGDSVLAWLRERRRDAPEAESSVGEHQ